jgi:hypothetical protein
MSEWKVIAGRGLFHNNQQHIKFLCQIKLITHSSHYHAAGSAKENSQIYKSDKRMLYAVKKLIQHNCSAIILCDT